jgi:integrase
MARRQDKDEHGDLAGAPEPNALVVLPVSQPLARFVPTSQQQKVLDDLLSAAVPANTRRSYRAAFKDWMEWAQVNGTPALPAEPHAVASYLAELALTKAPSTLGQRAAAIARAHHDARLPSPTRDPEVRKVVKAAKMQHVGEEDEAAPVVRDLLRKMLAATAPGVLGIRDRAILLVGWAGALRRSELARLTVEEFRFDPAGLWMQIQFRRPTKGDQDRSAMVPYSANTREPDLCPIAALQAWLKATCTKTGPIFRAWTPNGLLRDASMTQDSINDLIKKLVKACDIEPEPYSGHSLRAGFITQAFRDRIPLERIQAVTRHKDLKTLLKYRREADPISGSAAADIWGGSK